MAQAGDNKKLPWWEDLILALIAIFIISLIAAVIEQYLGIRQYRMK